MMRAHGHRPVRSRRAAAPASAARATAHPAHATRLGPAAVLGLQRLAGNRAVTPVVQRACAPYEGGERAKASAPAGVLGRDVSLAGAHDIASTGGDSVVVADFPIGSATLRSSTVSELKASWVGILERQPTAYEFVGYSDCVGEGGRNTALREQRAKAVAALFPKTAKRGGAVRGAPVADHAVDNNTPEERALNRSVIIQVPMTVEIGDIEITEPEEPGVTINRREPDSVGCSRPEREMLSVAWPAAQMMLNKAMEMAYVGKGSVNSYLLERYFGPDWMTHITDIRAGYQKIRDKWFDWNPKFECQAQTAGSCPNADPHYVTLAYVKNERHVFGSPTPYGNVHVCREGFLRSIGNLQLLSATVLHELSHRLDNTDDHAYCSNPPQCDISTKDAIDNADSYAQYARTVFNISI
jgi:outer membrane protein OmpA-like peptidoglycan-associated protein